MFPVSQSYVVVLKSEGSSFGEMVGFLYLTREDFGGREWSLGAE
jgi:hypothetical protein